MGCELQQINIKNWLKFIKTIYLYQKIEYNKPNFCLFYQTQKEEKEISKNILIIGTPRCGKSTISNQLFQRNKNYELLRGDIFSLALGILYRRKKNFPNETKKWNIKIGHQRN